MKTKLNLTIDEELVPLTKEYAKKRSKSVSGLVESLLREIVAADEMSFSQKWRGKFAISEREDARWKALKERYHYNQPTSPPQSSWRGSQTRRRLQSGPPFVLAQSQTPARCPG